MNGKLFNHPQLGQVMVSMRRSSNRITARWKGGIVHFTIPVGCTGDELFRAIETLTPRLLNQRPQVAYREGQSIDIAGLQVVIKRQSVKPDRVLGSMHGDTAYIEVGSEIDIHDSATTLTVSNLLCRIAEKCAPELLLPRAMELARKTGVTPDSWHIMRGFHTLGKCTSRREIYLSYIIAFLPQDLRDYIVWHELAHLSEMSHSPRFHAICDRYCGGREKELTAKLRNHNWTIIRK